MSGRGRSVDVLDRISDGVVSLDTEFRYTYVNERAEQLLGLDAESIVGEHVWDLFPEVADSVAGEKLRTARETREQVSFERYNEELERWFDVRVYPDGGGVSIVFRDVTERKEREQELRETNRQLNAIIENTEEAIYLKDRDGRYDLVNDAAAGLFDLDADSMVGRTDEELFDPESVTEIRAVDEHIVESGESVTEEAVRFIDGERYVFLDNKYPYRDGNGDVVGVIGISREITERKQQFRTLERAEILFQNTQDALFLVDCSGDEFRLERLNPAYERLTGLRNEELAGKTIREAFGDDDGAAIVSRYRECVEKREPIQYEEELSVPEPGSYWETRIAPVVVDGAVVQLVGATRDVTERREREQELRETTTILEAIIESSPDAIVMVNEDYEVIRWNGAAEEMFGWTAEEAIGERAPFVPEEKMSEFETFVEDIDADERKRGVETVRKTKDGERIDVSLSSTKVTVDGDLVGYMGTFEDIGDRLEYERRLERQRDDLELLTQMMSHDIRNDLGVVVGYAEVLEEFVDEDGRRHLEEVLAAANDAVDLTQSASDLAAAMRRSDLEREPIPLGNTLKSQIEQVRATHGGASVTVEGEVPSTRVLADERLDSVFRNLLKNAVQHNDKPVPEVQTSVEADDDTVVVRVSDNGPGIPDDMKSEMFGRGSKGLDSEGTGIGLYLVRTLVEQYDGDVRIEDNDPDGTVFSVELDRA
jgi:PAS domain S-box-containing protein